MVRTLVSWTLLLQAKEISFELELTDTLVFLILSNASTFSHFIPSFNFNTKSKSLKFQNQVKSTSNQVNCVPRLDVMFVSIQTMDNFV